MESIPGHLKHLFNIAVKSVQPNRLIKKNVQRVGNKLSVHNQTYELKGNCYIVGFGKAVLGMTASLERIIHDHLVKGIISVPIGIQALNADRPEMRLREDTKIQILEGAKNNIPDSLSLSAAKKIGDLVQTLSAGTLLFVLISGGGSALLPSPLTSLDFQEKSSLIQQLARRGADIVELNCVRKRLSQLKGGGLAVAAHPALIITLILSDVIGDSLETIASGPTCVNTDDMLAAYNVLVKYDLTGTISDSVRSILTTPKPNCHLSVTEGRYDHVNNILIGNNQLALQSVFEEAIKLEYIPVIICSDLQGIARQVGVQLAQGALEVCAQWDGGSAGLILEQWDIPIAGKLQEAVKQCKQSRRGLCMIFGGETTVLVQGSGRGGRNQEMALSFALHLHQNSPETSRYGVCFLSAGSDGIDGPTDAAGAVAYAGQITAAVQQHLDGERYLDDNDSNTFYGLLKDGEDLVKTGHTGTNVMDLQILVIKPL